MNALNLFFLIKLTTRKRSGGRKKVGYLSEEQHKYLLMLLMLSIFTSDENFTTLSPRGFHRSTLTPCKRVQGKRFFGRISQRTIKRCFRAPVCVCELEDISTVAISLRSDDNKFHLICVFRPTFRNLWFAKSGNLKKAEENRFEYPRPLSQLSRNTIISIGFRCYAFN